MLPYFQIIPNCSTGVLEMQPEFPAKSRKKRIDVPVHKHDSHEEKCPHKIYGANHPKKNRHKSRDTIADDRKISRQSEENEANAKISRRHLMKENDRLAGENEKMVEKIAFMDAYLTKKNAKYKEKLNALQNLNDEISQENAVLKDDLGELSKQYNECQNALALSKICNNCEDLKNALEIMKHDHTLMKKNNQELMEDLNMLKNVVYRLNVQLERYQGKLHGNNENHRLKENFFPQDKELNLLSTGTVLSESHRDHGHTPISWGKVNVHTLGPLLDAYQDAVTEKGAMVESYETELSNFGDKLRVIIGENENLHRQLTEDVDCSNVLAKQMGALKSELQTTKDQNDLLIKKCALKQDKIEEILKCYDQKVNQLKRDYKVLHEEYCKNRTEVVGLKEKNKSLVDVQNNFKNERELYIPISVHTASVTECKKWYEELKLQYEKEKIKMIDTIASLNDQIVELTAKASTGTKETADLENKIMVAEKQIKKAEAKYLDLQHTLNEVQLSKSACRKQLHKAMGFAKDLVAEQETLLNTLNQRQKENKAVKKLGNEIATRMHTLRSQLKTVQKEAFQELITVEERMQRQDSLIAKIKLEHEREIDTLKKVIKDKEERNLLFKENTSIPMPHYLLFRDKSIRQ